MGADGEGGRGLAPPTAPPSPLAERTFRRQTPKVGAECPNWARSDLCGGRSVMGLPTAIQIWPLARALGCQRRTSRSRFVKNAGPSPSRNVSGSAPPGLQMITGAPYTIAVPTLPIGSLLGDRDCSASNGHRDLKARSTGCVVLGGQRHAQSDEGTLADKG